MWTGQGIFKLQRFQIGHETHVTRTGRRRDPANLIFLKKGKCRQWEVGGKLLLTPLLSVYPHRSIPHPLQIWLSRSQSEPLLVKEPWHDEQKHKVWPAFNWKLIHGGGRIRRKRKSERDGYNWIKVAGEEDKSYYWKFCWGDGEKERDQSHIIKR